MPASSSLLAPQELQVHRTWDPAQHPQWLVFEVEGRLQVRPAQAAIVQHLLGHPGAIAQLNMGEGKTRVILPLLAMCLAAERKSIVSAMPVPATGTTVTMLSVLLWHACWCCLVLVPAGLAVTDTVQISS